MKRMRFSAQELYVIAVTAGKDKMYGIPDDFSWMEDEDIPAARQQVSDSLMDEDIIGIDFDGKLSVSQDYEELAEIYCSCRKCLTVNRQAANGASEDLIFWQYGDKYYRAEETEDDYYVFSTVDDLEIKAELTKDTWPEGADGSNETAIPQVALKRAKRFVTHKETDQALRVLKQNGADERVAAILLDGLQEKAQYLGFLLMDLKSGECEEREKSWLSSRGVILSMSSTVVNYRTCTVFTETTKDEVSQEIGNIVSAFLGIQ